MEEKNDLEFQKFIETCNEYELYFTIDEGGAFISRMNFLVKHGQIPPEHIEGVGADIITVSKMQAKAAEQTKRFGVNFELKEDEHPLTNGKKVKVPCPEYWVWLKHWNSWKNEFTDETWKTFTTALDNKESVVEYLPKKRWNEV